MKKNFQTIGILALGISVFFITAGIADHQPIKGTAKADLSPFQFANLPTIIQSSDTSFGS